SLVLQHFALAFLCRVQSRIGLLPFSLHRRHLESPDHPITICLNELPRYQRFTSSSGTRGSSDVIPEPYWPARWDRGDERRARDDESTQSSQRMRRDRRATRPARTLE